MISEAAYRQQKYILQQRYAAQEQLLELQKHNALRQMQFETVQLAGQLLQQFAGQSHAAALAVIVIQKGLAIAETVINTQVASMRALAELGPIAGAPVAASIEALGAVKIGLIAATGLLEAAGVGSSSTSLSVTPVSPSTGLPTTPALPTPISSTDQGVAPVSINVVIQGNVLSKDFVVNDVIPVIKDAVNNRDAVIIGQNSRQAQVIADGLGLMPSVTYTALRNFEPTGYARAGPTSRRRTPTTRSTRLRPRSSA
jgi:hypothetical protein